MPFEPVDQGKLSTAVVRQVEELILRGILRPGERLPAERQLAERLGVSRPSLREAFTELQERGLIVTQAGSGVFVADVLGSAFSPALITLLKEHDEAVFDYVSFRRDLEGMAAERAAKYGTDPDLLVIDRNFRLIEAAHLKRNPEEEARLDADFHLSIFEAAHNVIMLHMMRSMYQLLREGVFYNRQIMFKQRTTRDMLMDQHRAINDAIQARDPVRARQAVEDHLGYVEKALMDQRNADRNARLAQRRFERLAER